jgi:hypothetical protein
VIDWLLVLVWLAAVVVAGIAGYYRGYARGYDRGAADNEQGWSNAVKRYNDARKLREK